MGQTRSHGGKSLLVVHERNGKVVNDTDGCALDNGRAIGTYMHGLFDTPAMIAHWLNAVGISGIDVPAAGGLDAKMQQYALLADHVRCHVDVERISTLVKIKNK
jgi:adenosylcobyric acid synthase